MIRVTIALGCCAIALLGPSPLVAGDVPAFRLVQLQALVATAAPAKRKGWMTKEAYDWRQFWKGKKYDYRYPFAQGPQRPAPSKLEPWVFLSEPPNCPHVYRENWQGGMLPYLIHAADEVGADFLDRSEWSSVRATGRTLKAYWPDYSGHCHTYHAEFIEVEYTSARPVSAAMTATQVRRSGIDSPAWRSWRDIALSWCAANKGKCPEAAVTDLQNPPSAKGAAPHCPGNLVEIGNAQATLTTWNCNGGTTVQFVRVTNGWAVSKIDTEEGGD